LTLKGFDAPVTAFDLHTGDAADLGSTPGD